LLQALICSATSHSGRSADVTISLASIGIAWSARRRAPERTSAACAAEIGIHDHIAGAYLLRYSQESSWREDNRRVSNGDQVNRVAALAMKRGKSVDFTGYWQRHIG
jgi:hypothetical protein